MTTWHYAALGDTLQGAQSMTARNIHHQLTENIHRNKIRPWALPEGRATAKGWWENEEQLKHSNAFLIRDMHNSPFCPPSQSLLEFPGTAHHTLLLHPHSLFFLTLSSLLSLSLAEIFFMLHAVTVQKWSPDIYRLDPVLTEELLMPLLGHALIESRWI